MLINQSTKFPISFKKFPKTPHIVVGQIHWPHPPAPLPRRGVPYPEFRTLVLRLLRKLRFWGRSKIPHLVKKWKWGVFCYSVDNQSTKFPISFKKFPKTPHIVVGEIFGLTPSPSPTERGAISWISDTGTAAFEKIVLSWKVRKFPIWWKKCHDESRVSGLVELRFLCSQKIPHPMKKFPSEKLRTGYFSPLQRKKYNALNLT